MSVKFSADTTVDPAQEASPSARTKSKPKAALRSALKAPALAPNKVGADGRFELPAPPSADGEAQRQRRTVASTAEAVEAELAAAKATKEAMEKAFDKGILKKANAAARARQISSDADDNNVDDHDAGDCADEVDDVSSDDHDADGVDSTDGKDSSDADGSSVDDHDADDGDCDDEVDDGSGDDHDADGVDSTDGKDSSDADKKRLLLLLDKRNAYAKAQEDAFEKLVRKQNQDKLDSDARIASNVPSAADRKLLEQRNTHCRAEYARAVRERTERLEFEELVQDSYYDENFAASDNFIREYRALQERAKQACDERADNGEDVRTVRARWDAFVRYGHYGALNDAFFDPRNG
jgi:hypothetical protein